jgi:hypothetical protein
MKNFTQKSAMRSLRRDGTLSPRQQRKLQKANRKAAKANGTYAVIDELPIKRNHPIWAFWPKHGFMCNYADKAAMKTVIDKLGTGEPFEQIEIISFDGANRPKIFKRRDGKLYNIPGFV